MPKLQETSANAPQGLGENRGIRFSIRTGGKSYECTLLDRAAYERTKATRSGSGDSLGSSASSQSEKSF